MKKFITYETTYEQKNYTQETLKNQIFFTGFSFAVGAYFGGVKGGVLTAAASIIDLGLNYYDSSNHYYLTSMVLGGLASYSTYYNIPLKTGTDLCPKYSGTFSLIQNTFEGIVHNDWLLAKTIGTGMATGIVGAQAFNKIISWLDNKPNEVLVPYNEHMYNENHTINADSHAIPTIVPEVQA